MKSQVFPIICVVATLSGCISGVLTPQMSGFATVSLCLDETEAWIMKEDPEIPSDVLKRDKLALKIYIKREGYDVAGSVSSNQELQKNISSTWCALRVGEKALFKTAAIDQHILEASFGEFGALTVGTTPAGADVSYRGDFQDSVWRPVKKSMWLKTGKYYIRISHPGYVQIEVLIEVLAGETTDVVESLSKIP